MLITFFLTLTVVSAWLGAAGLLRLRTPLDRVHAVAFVNAAAGAALVVAAFVADGPSDRAFKILALVCVNLAAGAAVAHITGRALTVRAGKP